LSILDFSISFLCSVFCAQFTLVLSHWIVHSWSLSVFFVLCFVLSSLLSWIAGLSILDFSISFLCSVFCAQFTVVLK
jgi:hypothetical protein